MLTVVCTFSVKIYTRSFSKYKMIMFVVVFQWKRTMAGTIGLLLLAIPTLCLSCYAPPFFMGRECNAGPGLIGMNKDVKVYYSVSQVNNVGTLLCCQAWACGRLWDIWTPKCHSFRWYSLGCSYSDALIGVFPWGNTTGQPKVRCKGIPFGTFYRASRF